MGDIIELTNTLEKGAEIFSALSEPQLLHYYEPEAGLFIAESPGVIRLALDAGYKPVALLLERSHIEGEAKDIISRCGDIPVYTADSDILSEITGFALTRGALCAMRRTVLPDAQTLLRSAKRVAVLENVVNPTNVGAIIRSAAALGMDAVLLTHDCSDPLYRRAARVSMGTVFQVPWTYFKKQDNPAKLLHDNGFTTAALALTDNSVSIDDPCLNSADRLALFLGNEGYGLCPETISQCSHTVKIPMSNGVDSLNVAAASAVAFWQLRKRK